MKFNPRHWRPEVGAQPFCQSCGSRHRLRKLSRCAWLCVDCLTEPARQTLPAPEPLVAR